ncbi:MAG: ABC transporter ATP-binding protein [Candidatus Gracilibacteria bacterium]|nr:ABC transporter ATP-binding protein [Candidatus Gracilibacteria bacterium]
MIKINKLSKIFGENKEKVEIFLDMSLEIKSGDFISIIGPSGSGKSTFLNMLSGIDTDYAGVIDIFGTQYKNMSEDEITMYRGKNISYIFQNFKLIDNLTLRENIDLIIELNGLERNFSTDEILEIVGLKNKSENYVFNLSGGERQRVAIARAFVGKTKLLLADEPTGSLDQKNKKIIIDLIEKLHIKTKNTIILITHDTEVANKSDTVYEMKNYNLVTK